MPDRSTADGLGGSSWRRDQRRSGLEAFAALAMPTSADESWRYVEHGVDLDSLPLAGPTSRPMPAENGREAAMVIADGWVGGGLDAYQKEQRPESLVPATTDRFAAAHTAFATGAFVLEVPKGKTHPTVFIDVQATQPGTVTFPHVIVSVGENAEASVIMSTRSVEGDMVVVPRVELMVGDGGRLSFTTMQRFGTRTRSVSHQRAVIGKDATLRLGEVGLGGAFARLDLGVDLVGGGASVDLVGVFFGEKEQTLDYRLVITHVGRHTSSKVFLKGAVEDQARSVFTGLLRIEKPAIRSHAFETNRNLVLSEGAAAHSVPNLEILCNDVVCGHGSSVGPLDPEHLYYLQSRGLSRPRAERVLVRGFFEEVLARLPAPELAEDVREALTDRFVAAQKEGRVR